MFMTCKCVALSNMPVILSSRHDAQWSEIKMQFHSLLSQRVEAVSMSVCVVRLCTYQRGHHWCPICVHVVRPHAYMTNIRNLSALSDPEKSVSCLRGKSIMVPLKSYWFMILAAFFSLFFLLLEMNTDIVTFLEFSQTSQTLYGRGSIFLLLWVWWGWENEAELWKWLIQTTGEIWNIISLLVNAVLGIFHS